MVNALDHSSTTNGSPERGDSPTRCSPKRQADGVSAGTAKKPKEDLDAMRKAVEDAAAVSTGLWISYLFLLFYIAIATGAVTHLDLLLENSVKLPFLGIELPLVAFFFVAPLLLLVVHAYTLVHFVMLGTQEWRVLFPFLTILALRI